MTTGYSHIGFSPSFQTGQPSPEVSLLKIVSSHKIPIFVCNSILLARITQLYDNDVEKFDSHGVLITGSTTFYVLQEEYLIIKVQYSLFPKNF